MNFFVAQREDDTKNLCERQQAAARLQKYDELYYKTDVSVAANA